MLLTLAQKKLIFVCGKGGVGKTSVASSLALARADTGARVLLVSTDPAHSLGHLWQQKIGDRITLLGPEGLHGLEIDPARTTDEHLAQIRVRLQRWVPEHLRSAVDRHLQLAHDAPGAHEAALLERITSLLEEQKPHFDLIVFDTAPSGHTTRLVQLPETMSAWTRGMLHRHDHAEKFSQAMQALDGDDPNLDLLASSQKTRQQTRDEEIRHVLYTRQQRLIQLRNTLQDAAHTAFVAVCMGERLPVLETLEMVTQFTQAGMHTAALVVNKRSPADAGQLLASRHAQEGEYILWIQQKLPDLPLVELPLLAEDVTSLKSLRLLGQLLQSA